MHLRSFPRLALLWLFAFALLPAASQAQSTFSVLIDSDNSDATGCTVSSVQGTFLGADYELVTTVNTAVDPPQVTGLALNTCTAAPSTWSPYAGPNPFTQFTPPWPAPPALGLDAIETYLPLSALSVGPVVQLGYFSGPIGAPQDVLFTTDGTTSGPPILFGVPIAEIPTLAEWSMLLLALLLLGSGMVALRRRGSRAGVMLGLLLISGGLGIAAATSPHAADGNILDWTSHVAVATDGTGDAAVNADIGRAFAHLEGGVFFFRIDADCNPNLPPVANDDTATVSEDPPGAVTIDVLANDTDPESDPFSIASVTQPANGTVTITNAGADLTYLPDANYCNTPPGTTLDTFTYTLTPGSDSATVSVTVTCVDDAPTANDDAATVAEDAAATAVPVLANDSDPESDPFTIASVTQPGNGTVVITGGGTGLTYQPNADYCNTPPGTTLDTFTYTLAPGGDTATVTMTVTCGDDAPTAVDDAATVAEDSGATTIDVQANDTDVDGGTNTISAVTQPANGTVAITNGGADLSYTPDADYCNDPPGTTLDTFTYTLAPGGSVATVTVTVTCVDDAPVANDDGATVAEDAAATAIDVLANDTDTETDPFTITSVTQPVNGTVVITGGGTALTYEPDPDYCNSPPGTTLDTFTYTLTPGGDTATVSVTVTCVNDDPTANDDSATVAEDAAATAVGVLANDTDPEGDPFTITSVTQPANGTVAITGGGTGLTYQPNGGYCNAPPGTTLDTFTYTLTPGGDTATVSMTVTCIDDPPVAVDDGATVNEDSGANTINVLANDTDSDGGPIAITSVTQPANGTVVITNAGADLTYAPAADYCNNPPGSALDTFTYTLAPGGDSATVTVTVTCLNDAPALDLDADDSGGTAGADFAVAYTEGDAATLLEDATDATVSDIDNTTLASLTVTLTNLFDTGDEVLSADVTGTAITTSYVTVPGAPGTGTLTLTGPDTVANFQTVLRTVRYQNSSNAPDATARVVTFVANDGTANSNTATATVTITAVDTAPTAVDDSATVNEDSGANPIDVLANDTDPDGGPISITSVTQPANGAVIITGGGTGLTYQPNAEYCNSSGSPDTFTYTLTPGGDSATVSVTVTCVDDPPTAVDDSATVGEDSGANAIAVLTNDTDPDGGPISITSVTQGTNGSVVITGGGTGLTYQPNANYCNSVSGPNDTFTYTLSPGGGTATVTVTVTCVDDNPVAVADAATVTEDSGANAVDVLANDTDVDGGPISITSTTQPTNGTVVITGGGTGLTYAPNANYCNTPIPPGTADTFTYTLTPGGSVGTVSMTVTCVDDPPVAVNDSATVLEDSGASAIPVLANDTDPDGGPISITSTTQPTNGTVVITGGGTGLTYAPNANYCNNPPGSSLDTFTYTLTPASATPTATVTMTVTCVNDPPVADNDAFDFIGNTELRVDLAAATTPHALETTPSTFGVIDGDSDPVENHPIQVTGIVGCADTTAPYVCVLAGIGTVTMESNGRFSFVPLPGDAGASESFQYTLCDTGTPAPACASPNPTVTLTRFERIWYVKNDAAAGGNGTSTSPFDAVTAANLADDDGDADLTDDSDVAGDYLFVYYGSGAANGTVPFVLEQGQHLIGEFEGLSIPVNLNGNGSPTVLVAQPGATACGGQPCRPLLSISAANNHIVADPTNGGAWPATIAGFRLTAPNGANAIDITLPAAFNTAGSLAIRNNVITAGNQEAVDLNLGGQSALQLAFHDNTLTGGGGATSHGLAIDETGTGSLTITRFDDNVVSGDTGGSGIIINTATFDAVAGGGIDQVDANNLLIGSSGNPVGGAGMLLATVQGNLFFDDMDIFAAVGTGLQVTGTGAGMTFSVVPANPDGIGTSTIDADSGAALDVSNTTLDLRLADLDSNTTAGGVSLTTVAGQFRAPTGSQITKTGGTGAAFSIDNSAGGTTVLTSAYAGTINNSSATGRSVSVNSADSGSSASFTGQVTDSPGQGVTLTNNTGATISFSGGLTLSTATNTGFNATGGGTLTVTDPAGAANNTITTTSGTALNVNGTTIAAGDLTFERISAGTSGTPTNGIVLNNTGALGELIVTGNGGSCTTAATCTGGAIQNTTGDGISLTSTRTPSFTRIFVGGSGAHGINASSLTAGLTLNNSFITNSGNADNEYGLNVSNVGGTTAISGTTFNNAADDLVHFVNNNTNATLTVDGSSAFVFPAAISATANAAIALQPNGTTNLTATVQSTTFTNIRSDSIQWGAATAGSNGTSTLNFSNNTITVNTAGRASGFSLSCQESTTGNITIANNNFSGAGGNGVISIDCNDSSLLTGTVSGNIITNPPGIGMFVAVDEAAEARLTLNGNTVTNSGGDGIQIVNFGGVGVSDLFLAITNNQVNGHSANTSVSFVGGVSVTSFEDNACIELRGNSVTGTPAGPTQCGGAPCVDYYIEEVGGTMQFEEVPNTATVNLDAAYVNSTNDAGPVTIFGTIALTNGAQCPFP